MLSTSYVVRAGMVLMGSALLPFGAIAGAPGPTGAEITGHAVSVDSSGIVNIVHFDPGGTARIVSPAGREVQGRWWVADNTLCLSVGAAKECWPYQAEFVAGQPVVLTSDCAATSRWTALSTEPPPPPPVKERAGERG
jgi:hypothetical protein